MATLPSRADISATDASRSIRDRLAMLLAAAGPAGANARLILVMLAAATLLYVLRRPTSLASPTFVAEDGSVFFSDALAGGGCQSSSPIQARSWSSNARRPGGCLGYLC